MFSQYTELENTNEVKTMLWIWDWINGIIWSTIFLGQVQFLTYYTCSVNTCAVVKSGVAAYAVTLTIRHNIDYGTIFAIFIILAIISTVRRHFIFFIWSAARWRLFIGWYAWICSGVGTYYWFRKKKSEKAIYEIQ